jgi:hypothetical protein
MTKQQQNHGSSVFGGADRDVAQHAVAIDHELIADLLVKAANADSREARNTVLSCVENLLCEKPRFWCNEAATEIGMALYGHPDDPVGLRALTVEQRIGRALVVNRRMQNNSAA